MKYCFLFFYLMYCSCSYAQNSVELSVNPDKILNRVDEKVYGQFLEHIYHSVSNGIWGENVWNRSFEDWTTEGKWIVYSNGNLKAEAIHSAADFNLGSGKNYEVSIDIKRTEGNGAVLLGVRDQRRGKLNTNHFYNFFDAGKTDQHILQVSTGWVWHTPVSKVEVIDRTKGSIGLNKWYTLKVRCEENRITTWINGIKQFERQVENAPLNGAITLKVDGIKADFRNLAIKSLDNAPVHQTLSPLKNWSFTGSGFISESTQDVVNDHKAVHLYSDAAFVGIHQKDNYSVKANDLLKGAVYLKGDVATVYIELLAGAKVLSSKEIKISANWREYPVELPVATDFPMATLRISTKQKGNLFIDQLSLMNQSSISNQGFRPELMKAAAALKPSIVRWPGGSFVELYDFEKGLGKQVEREGKERWEDFDPFSFGTDEYIEFCRRVGAEPQIVVPIGYHNSFGYVPDYYGKTDWLQKALNWLEYCNGDKNTKWGAQRAANGHPEPYHVKYWEIDNEVWKMDPKLYAQLTRMYFMAMKSKDPSIKIIGCGSGRLGREGIGLDSIMINDVGEYIDYISPHYYQTLNKWDNNGVEEYGKYLDQLGTWISRSKNPAMKIYVSEWNLDGIDMRTGLFAGGFLNRLERTPSVEMAAPALYLRHTSAGGWNNAFINFDNRGWFPAPNYVVMKLWRDNYQPNVIEIKGEAKDLNITATRSDDGKTVVLKIVNPTDREVAVKLNNTFVGSPQLFTVAGTSLTDKNSMEAPHNIRPVNGAISKTENSILFTLPALSASVVTLLN